MPVNLIACGPIANESEEKSFTYLKTRLISEARDQHWILLTNLAFSFTQEHTSDEIDIVVIGPGGVRVVEIKHWHGSWIKKNEQVVENEAERLNAKARKIGTTLRKVAPELPFVSGVFLLSRNTNSIQDVVGRTYRGATLYGLKDWKDAIGFNEPTVLMPEQIGRLAHKLHPKSTLTTEGFLRRLAGYVNLELISPKEDRFHRIYKAKHPQRRDRVILHLYDLSADNGSNLEAKAKRGFEAIHRLQLYPWAPRILDSFQEAPGFPGEMYFYTIVDPEAPTVAERAADPTWDTTNRVMFARESVQAVRDLHTADREQPLIHRNISPQTLLVKYDNTPILTGFEYTRIPEEVSIASSSPPTDGHATAIAPEVLSLGRGAADQRSDVYSLCTSLVLLFEGRHDLLSQQAYETLKSGMAERPDERASLEELAERLSELLGETVAEPPAPPARFWTEDQVVTFRGNRYRIVSKLGSGGIGTAFKVVQLDRSTGADMGTFVGKVAHDKEKGEQILRAYSLVRSHLGHTGLSTVFEVAQEWKENEFIALMKWIPGAPLIDYSGVFPLLAEDLQELSGQELAIRWIKDACRALDVLHSNGLIHGDVSPRNLIVAGSDLVLTDYDFVQRVGEERAGIGTRLYCAPVGYPARPASPSDDIFALAASFFRVLFDRQPFRAADDVSKQKGLWWTDLPDDEYPRLKSFFDKATHPDPEERFQSVHETLALLEVVPKAVAAHTILGTQTSDTVDSSEGQEKDILDYRSVQLLPIPPVTEPELREQKVEWLKSILQSYPGSRWGNQETRGLDSEFAAQTYVETELERTIMEDIHSRRVRLVILCGNAGDGKTALLQHLAERLGLGRRHSSERILEGQTQDGLLVRMNLDGSASWKDRSADEILDGFLASFLDGPPEEDIFHLLAINDGRLLEWIEATKHRNGDGKTLLFALERLLNREPPEEEHSYIRFVSLNERSLVGGIARQDGNANPLSIDTRFLQQIIDHLYGGEQAEAIWTPCLSCTARERCEVFRSARLFGPENMPDLADIGKRRRARQRLFEALQAVHLRGETHITMRELRAALVYILFGVHYCDDYHTGERQEEIFPYWDRAFQADSPFRQGEVLGELPRFDPGLEAHPKIDRYLLNKSFGAAQFEEKTQDQALQLASARRRAYFEWAEEQIEQIAQDPNALGLAGGEHLQEFLNLPLADEEKRQELCARLCSGISRLEDLPPQAYQRSGVVPLRITPRTPIETAFWVEKPLERFRLEADLLPNTEDIEQLHRQASLIYRYEDGQEERLRMGADLFRLLLELADGYQLGDVSSDDTFTRLSIFVQRLVREDERMLLAWTPIQDETVFQISADLPHTSKGRQQQMTITPLSTGG